MKMKRMIASFALAAATLFGGGAALMSSDAITANAAVTPESNQTLTIRSGYKTGMLGTVTGVNSQLGATIEFDLYSTNFKDLPYETSYDVINSSGTSGSLASIAFVWGKDDRYPYENPNKAGQSHGTPMWHVSNDDLTEKNFGGFQYFCNGQIKEWTEQGNYAVITGGVGNASKFMEAGYSYKVSLSYAEFTFEGKTYNEGGGSPWFIMQRKGLFEDESEYEIFYAYAKAVFIKSEYTDGTLAGFEVAGLAKYANLSGDRTSADGEGHSVEMEIDNLRIYDGMTYSSAAKKSSNDFQSTTASTFSSMATTVPDYPLNNSKITVGDFTCVSTNFSEPINDTEYCLFGLNTRQLYPLYFKDTSGTTLSTQKTYTGLDFSSTRIDAGSGMVYKFDYTALKAANWEVSDAVTVTGTKVANFKLSIDTGTPDVTFKTVSVGVNDYYYIKKDLLVREGYDFLGLSKTEGGGADYKIGTSLDMRCQDQSLYAVWKQQTFVGSYVYDGKIFGRTVVNYGDIPYYRGETPTLSGYVFTGWNKTAKGLTADATYTANFERAVNVYSNNTALKITNSFTMERTGIDCDLVEFTFEALNFKSGATLKVCGEDITSYVEEGRKMKVTVSSTGELTVYLGYIGSENYEQKATVTTTAGTNETVSFEFNGKNGNIVIDNMTATYDGKKTYEETFNAAIKISNGVYNNYYAISGSGASIVTFAKDLTVTFMDTTKDREVAVIHTYEGGIVECMPTVTGVEGTISWDKTQSDLNNVTENMTVSAALTWTEYKITFVVTPIYGYQEVSKTFSKVKGIYGETVDLPTTTVGDYGIIGWTDLEGATLAKYSTMYTFSDSDITLYSVWGGEPQTCKFYAEDGETELQTVLVEKYGTASFSGELPEKAGYDFVGWEKYLYNSKTKEYELVEDGFNDLSNVTEETHFVAKYEKTGVKVSVTIDGGSGTGNYEVGATVTIAFDEGSDAEVWVIVRGGVHLEILDEDSGEATFVVGDENVYIRAMTRQAASDFIEQEKEEGRWEGEIAGDEDNEDGDEEEEEEGGCGCGSSSSNLSTLVALLLAGVGVMIIRKKSREEK